MGLVEAPYRVGAVVAEGQDSATSVTGADDLQAHAAALKFGLSGMGSSEDDYPQSVVCPWPLLC